jgi:hypothetical protein
MGSARAQLLQPFAVKEALTQTAAKAHTDFASDSYLSHALFASVSYSGVSLNLDSQTGMATGWLYRYYSPGKDSARFFLAIKLQVVGMQVVDIPVDTVMKRLPFVIESTGLAEPWVDSPQALDGSKSGGGSAFLLAHAEAKVSLAVIVNNPVATKLIPQGLYWLFSYTAISDTLNCLVFGESGQAFKCESVNAPHITSLAKTLARVGEPYSYSVKATGTPVPAFSLQKNPAGMTIDANTGEILWTPTALQTGSQDVTVRAENSLGFDEQMFQISVQPAASVPKITSTPVTQTLALQQYLYALTATGSPAPIYRLTNPPAGMVLDSVRGRIAWKALRNQTGPHTITVTAINASGQDQQVYTLTVNSVPEIALIPNQAVKAGQEFRYTAVPDAFPAAKLTFDAAPTGMTIDSVNGEIIWTPTLQQIGVHPVIIRAKNPFGFGQQNFDISVSDPTPADVVSQPRIFSVYQNYPNPVQLSRGQQLRIPVEVQQPVSLRITVFNAAGEIILSTISETLSAGRHGLTLNTQNLPSGNYFYSIQDPDNICITKAFVILK